MDISQSDSADKPARQGREYLLNRRRSETIASERDGSRYQMTIGFYPDGRIGEVFLNADRSDSLLDALVSDAAIAISFALQHGADLAAIRSAMKRNSRGEPSSPIGAALDLVTL